MEYLLVNVNGALFLEFPYPIKDILYSDSILFLVRLPCAVRDWMGWRMVLVCDLGLDWYLYIDLISPKSRLYLKPNMADELVSIM